MLLAKECSSVVNIGVVDQDLVYLLVDGLSGCGCISRREACHETDVVIDECLSGKSELAAVSLQLSLRELVIFEDVMLGLALSLPITTVGRRLRLSAERIYCIGSARPDSFY